MGRKPVVEKANGGTPAEDDEGFDVAPRPQRDLFDDVDESEDDDSDFGC